MIHIFELTPKQPARDIEPNKDIVRFLPGCDSGGRYGVCNWFKYPLGATWTLDTNDDIDRKQNVEIWRRIFKGIDKRVTDDPDGDDSTDVFCIVNTKSPGMLATIVASRNDYLRQLLSDKVSQEEFDVAYKYTKIWVPVFEQVFLTEEEQSRNSRGHTFKWNLFAGHKSNKNELLSVGRSHTR